MIGFHHFINNEMIYFISDTHLGLNYGDKTPIEREQHLCRFLDSIKESCEELFLVGDIFDFWFEWNKTVPQGFARTLGRLADFTDRGITVHFFIGNHDLWLNNYLRDNIGLTIHTKPLTIEREEKKLFITHGDTLYKYRGFSRLLEVVFKSKVTRWIFQRVIHPDSMVRFGRGWSQRNRKKHSAAVHNFTEEDDNWVIESRKILASEPDINYFIYGHLHIPIMYSLSDSSEMVVLGEWVDRPHYGVLSGGVFELREFPY